ncbi:carbonic anhydrase [Thermodesulfatator atlanticus]|uniref:carbonic anhydrase n=1 Tax=Thermodesulfatator atlanticus TaxID=501497 RepID=UPI0003B2E922|nr:carbonic anhydrase [Thermodesulfatator atlanticus]
MFKRFQVFLVICFLILCGSAFASGHGSSGDPSSAMEKLAVGNNQFVVSHDASYFAPYQKSQHPFATVITCSDARVHMNVLLNDPIDKLFVIRNIGNQLIVAKGSIDYGILHLHTPVLLILGHTGCGAVKAAMSDYSKETEGIIRELDHLHIPLSKDDGHGSFAERWLKNVERNVDWQVAQALEFYPDLVKSGKLVVVGAVYDFMNAYGKGYGRMVVINVNGETSPVKIKKHPVMEKLSANLLNVVVGSHH